MYTDISCVCVEPRAIVVDVYVGGAAIEAIEGDRCGALITVTEAAKSLDDHRL